MRRRQVTRQPERGEGRARSVEPAAVANRKGWPVGNAATGELLRRQSEGEPLDPQLQLKMEQAYGVPLDTVRVHRDSSAQQAAAALQAEAFTQGDYVALSATAPALDSPAGAGLMAHEIAHVVQQRGASHVDARRVSSPGDAGERNADTAARDAMAGGRASLLSGGSVPGIQRQFAAGKLTSDQVAALLATYLQRVLETQGGKALKITPEVQRDVSVIFADEPMLQAQVELWMKGTLVPGDPAAFAKQVMKHRKTLVPEERVKHLKKLPKRPGRLTRMQHLVEGTAPYETPDAQIAKWEFDHQATQLRDGEDAIGPAGVDVLRVGRVLGGVKEAWKGPEPEKPAPVEATTYPAAEKGIEAVAPKSLKPAGAKGDAGEWADAREVARSLAAEFDIAHKNKKGSFKIVLGDNYGRLTSDQEYEVLEALLALARRVKETLPHRAAGVHTLRVQLGEKKIVNLELNVVKPDKKP